MSTETDTEYKLNHHLKNLVNRILLDSGVRYAQEGFVLAAMAAHEKVAILYAVEQELGNLLALIHGDAGEYEKEHGTFTAVEHAKAKIGELRKQLGDLRRQLGERPSVTLWNENKVALAQARNEIGELKRKMAEHEVGIDYSAMDALIAKYAAAVKRNALEINTMPEEVVRQHFSEFAKELIGAVKASAPIARPAAGTAITPEILTDALSCFWNAAIGPAHDAQNSTVLATVGAIAEGIAAVQRRLEEWTERGK